MSSLVSSFFAPRSRVRGACAAWLAIGLATALPAGAQTPGLDFRPANGNCKSFPRPDVDASVQVVRVFPSLSIPDLVALAQAPHDGSFYLYATNGGQIGRFANQPNVSTRQTLLQLPVNVPHDGGLVQLIFHPDFPSDPRIFVNYTVPGTRGEANDLHISSFALNATGTAIVPGSERILIDQPRGSYHSGGFMAFGPDGLLYIGLGDGSELYPDNRPEDPTDLRGDILRIDVDDVPPGQPYGIPSGPLGNPFAGNPICGPTGNLLPCPEIFARGFRNPYRGAIDPQTGDIWVGDVGNTAREEVDKVVLGGDYGWSVCEGSRTLPDFAPCNVPGLINPVVDYTHSNGNCAVIGGVVYRGSAIPALQGRFLFADYCTSKISAVGYDLTTGQPYEEILVPGGSAGLGRITNFTVRDDGEVLVVAGSAIYRLADSSSGTPVTAPPTLSATGCFEPAAGGGLQPAPGLIPFDLHAPLWSDGANKRRWMLVPDGARISRTSDGDFVFPPGTLLVKEFSFNGVPHETRIFQRHLDGGWTGYSYEWRANGSDADLLPAGKVKTLPSGHTWTYPSAAECLRCHTPEANFALGPEIAQLNGSMLYPQTGRVANQLETLQSIGLFQTPLPAPVDQLPALAGLDDDHVPVARRARSYLHSNCSGCHRPGGSTQAPMDFRFTTPTPQMQACNVSPVFGAPGYTPTAPSGLVAHYAFEETAGATVQDSSVFANHGTIVGATRTTAGRAGRALSFDGIDDRVDVPDRAWLDFTTGMTVTAWLNPTAPVVSDWRTAVLKEASGGLAYALYASGPPGPAFGVLGNPGGIETFAGGGAALPAATWTHLAVTFDGTALRLYRNGLPVATTPRTTPIPVSTRPLRIGGNLVWGEYFRGRIDEVRVYDRALTATEISSDMAAADLPPGGVEPKILLPGSPAESVLWLRTGSREPVWQMPPLATALVDDGWHALAAQWISSPQVCATHPDSDGDGVTDDVDNCPTVPNASQRDENRDGVGDACGACNDGIDNDGDGRIDFRADGTGDRACASASSPSEVTGCQDGLDNDGDGRIDFDGGASLDLDHNGRIDAAFNPATPLVGAPDPQCVSPTRNREARACGLGTELALLLGPLAYAHRRRRRR